MKPKTALTIAGSDSGGGAGIQADLKTFSALEVHGFCVITSLTAQNSTGVQGTFDIPESFVGEQIDSVVEDFELKWAKTGMLSNGQIIEKVGEKIEEKGINLVVDPVMIAASGSPLIRENAIGELKNLFKKTVLVTPNIDEAEKLTDIEIKCLEDVKKAAVKISKFGPKAVLIKGGHLNTGKIHNLLFYENEFEDFSGPRVPILDVHGTGCTFSAAITAELAKGETLRDSVSKAGEFMNNAIRGRLNIGRGTESVNPLADSWKVTGDGEEITKVQKAAKRLVNTPKFAKLIPEVGTNLGMAPEGTKKAKDFVGLTGRIIRVKGKPYLSGVAAPGGSEHVANFVLTAKEYDPKVRAGMNIKFSDKILETCKKMDLEIASFDRDSEPRDSRTMVWGPKNAIEKLGGVPDIIYDRGAVGKEPMIRILGEEISEVSEIALQVAKTNV